VLWFEYWASETLIGLVSELCVYNTQYM